MSQTDSNMPSTSGNVNKVHGIIFIVAAFCFVIFYWPFYSIYSILIAKLVCILIYLFFGLLILKSKTQKTLLITALWIGIIIIVLFYPREAGSGGGIDEQDCHCLGFMYEPVHAAPSRVMCAGIPYSCTTCYYDQSNNTSICTPGLQ